VARACSLPLWQSRWFDELAAEALSKSCCVRVRRKGEHDHIRIAAAQ
jgi:hypothetical protein